MPELRLLVEAGSSHAWLSSSQQTPLHLACLSGNPGIIEYLIETCGADPGARDDVGYTPLAIAAQHGHEKATRILLNLGLDRLGRHAYRDALSGVAMSGCLDMLRQLILAEDGARVRGAKTSAGMTALHYAAGYCHPLATAMLLEAGCYEGEADGEGKTPRDLVDTMRSPYVKHGIGRRRIRQMLARGPAFRATSWKWPAAAGNNAAGSKTTCLRSTHHPDSNSDSHPARAGPGAEGLSATTTEMVAIDSVNGTADSVNGGADLEAEAEAEGEVEVDSESANGDAAASVAGLASVEMNEEDFDDAFAAATQAVAAAARYPRERGSGGAGGGRRLVFWAALVRCEKLYLKKLTRCLLLLFSVLL